MATPLVTTNGVHLTCLNNPMPLTLPTGPNKFIRNDPRLLLIYGAPKIGKTTILAQLVEQVMAKGKKALILETDPRGAEFLSTVSLQLDSLEQFTEAKNAIVAANKPYDFIAIDVLDHVEDWCFKKATDNYKLSPIGKNFEREYGEHADVTFLPNGSGYQYPRPHMHLFINQCLALAPQIIFTGHVRDKMLTQNAETTSSKDLDLTGKIRNIVCSGVDSIGLLSRTPKGLMQLNFRTFDTITNGSRSKHLAGKTFTLSESDNNILDWSFIYPDWFKNNP